MTSLTEKHSLTEFYTFCTFCKVVESFNLTCPCFSAETWSFTHKSRRNCSNDFHSSYFPPRILSFCRLVGRLLRSCHFLCLFQFVIIFFSYYTFVFVWFSSRISLIIHQEFLLENLGWLLLDSARIL